VPVIHSEFGRRASRSTTHPLEELVVNAGLLFSNDKLYDRTEGRRLDDLGIRRCASNKYLMHDIRSPDVQPGWRDVAYNGRNTIYASFAQYIRPRVRCPVPRRGPQSRDHDQRVFDANVVLYVCSPRRLLRKLFVDGIKPRRVDEFLVGTRGRSTRRGPAIYYRTARSHFWEDTNNNARSSSNHLLTSARAVHPGSLCEARADRQRSTT